LENYDQQLEAINVLCFNGLTPLHYAANSKSSESMKLLLENGALLESEYFYGKTPYTIVLESEDEKCRQVLKDFARAQCYKTFYDRNKRNLEISLTVLKINNFFVIFKTTYLITNFCKLRT